MTCNKKKTSCRCKKFVIEKISKNGKFNGYCQKCGQLGSGLFKADNDKALIKLISNPESVKYGKGFINSAINNLPFELHLPCHNFTGPGTQLLWGKHRLNPDLSFKDWSKPINRVDKASYNHDVCFLKNKDTKVRNEVCDSNMLKELDDIENPTIRERIERAIVKPIIKTKKRFGMGLGIYCVKCKEETKTKDLNETISKNNRPILKGICIQCGSKKCRFLGCSLGKVKKP